MSDERAYIVTQPNKTVLDRTRSFIKRRGPTASVPGFTTMQAAELGDIMFSKFGLGQYVGCITGEMGKRPIPHVFKKAEVQPLTNLYVKWAPLIMERVFKELMAPVQTYNTVSRLGWPIFLNPENKGDVLRLAFNGMEEDLKAGYYDPSYIVINVRLQPEPKKKTREFNFINARGEAYAETIDEAARRVTVKGLGSRVAARTRNIFNMPLPNLWKQVLDTAIHNVFLTKPAFHHDMFGKHLLPVTGYHMCFDVKHFERHTAEIVRIRGREIIGGLYGLITHLFATIPYYVVSDDWSAGFFVRPNIAEGWSDQFASGDSAVAAAQKEVFTAIYAEYFVKTRSMSAEEAITTVFRGGDGTLTIRNYGDDNSVSGDENEVRALLEFVQQYLTAEEETPPKFLGFEWTQELGWRLPLSSYLLKTYLNERPPFSNFRKYPYLGWSLKRDIYARLGVPEIAAHVFPFEDRELAARGWPWSRIMEEALIEAKQAQTRPGLMSPNYVMGKDYLMTKQEQIATGMFIGLRPEQTAPIIRKLVGEKWKGTMRI